MFVWLLAPMLFLFLFVQWWIALISLPIPSLILVFWLYSSSLDPSHSALFSSILYRRCVRQRLYTVDRSDKRNKTGDIALAESGGSAYVKDDLALDPGIDPDRRKDELVKQALADGGRPSRAMSATSSGTTIRVDVQGSGQVRHRKRGSDQSAKRPAPARVTDSVELEVPVSARSTDDPPEEAVIDESKRPGEDDGPVNELPD